MMTPRKQGRLTGKPVLVDKLDPELGAKVVELVQRDMERAARERAEQAERAAAAGKPGRKRRGRRRGDADAG
ncbi:MAG: hypothetical protein HY744_13645 [Deltaproteobacteria bacterium]|nr:hypothetical protein [Deltaproteobacteria bacterium]